MTRPIHVLLTLALYAAMMWAAWWLLRQVMPIADAWIVSHAGETAAWAAIIVPWLAGVAYLWRDLARRRRVRLPSR